MQIHHYSLCWNQANLLGFFFRHYDPWVDRYVIYDDGSTDGSLDMLRAHPKVDLRRFTRSDRTSFVRSEQHWANSAWQESRGQADWVLVCDIDEHLLPPGRDLRTYLADCLSQGVTLVPALGYQMISETFPEPHEHLVRTRRVGAPFADMNKLNVLNPNAIQTTDYAPGRHLAQPTGDIRYPVQDALMLLHYKYMGFEETLRRHHAQSFGLGPTDHANNWGHQYDWSRMQLGLSWQGFAARAVDIGAPDFDLAEHPSERWWR